MCYSYLAQHLVVRVGRTEVITYGGDERRTHRADPCSLVSHALRFLVCARPVCLARFYPQALLQHAPTDHPHSCTRLAVKPRNKLRRGGELGAHAWCDVRTWPAILPKPRRHVGDLWSGDRLWSVAVLPAVSPLAECGQRSPWPHSVVEWCPTWCVATHGGAHCRRL
eukprot:CAMPEP_0181169072 /NCGR_PEP_ID=MMETSP1096-20121128/616_1 /TAXON_ID=156174 ORGANISM="Chrysochromulina ericina, Strain CCMP281" /NCGR_SAMPLE_ID=MMETSP1096 /ASSEMBLY_ACC=CAM_ASM_000453 /LENGTH=166 /DNA_ID=CAMNT_0023256499 /DNA_START=114 /DNA_END=614 /DNA_ORIENTATION=+